MRELWDLRLERLKMLSEMRVLSYARSVLREINALVVRAPSINECQNVCGVSHSTCPSANVQQAARSR